MIVLGILVAIQYSGLTVIDAGKHVSAMLSFYKLFQMRGDVLAGIMG